MKKQLTGKLAANRARRERERFLAILPPHLALPLAAAHFLVPPDSTPLLGWFFAKEESVAGSVVPAGYRYHESFYPEVILALAEQFPVDLDSEPSFFLPEDDLPVFCISFGWVRAHFRQIFPFSRSGLGVVTQSYHGGLVSDSYCGYHEHVPTDDEIVYQLAFWHPTAYPPTMRSSE